MACDAEKCPMDDRDPNEVNDHVKVAFDDVLAEPDGVRTFDCLWRCSYRCFNCSKLCCYRFFTIFCALPWAFVWGLSFGFMTIYHVWMVTPYLRCYAINMGATQKFVGTCINAFCAPFAEACGYCFSKIMVTIIKE